MSIAHIVFDLPLEGFFDYSIPQNLEAAVIPGVRVKVAFGNKTTVGYVIAIAKETNIPKIKPIKSVVDKQIIFNTQDLAFAKDFAKHYGCCLGEALATFVRHRKLPVNENASKNKPSATLYHCPDGRYLPVIEELTREINDYRIVVPDAAVANGLALSVDRRPFVGLRSSIFEAFNRARLIIVIDEDNASYKQEQSPMYETRQVVLMAQKRYGFDVAFISTTPSVELMHEALSGNIILKTISSQLLPKLSAIDLSNYRFLDKKIISPPVRNALDSNIKSKKKTLIVYNRKGKDATNMQKELSSLFPTGRIATFDKNSKELPLNYDILITTQAILRLKHKLKVETVVFVDFDSELHWADTRASFKAWALVMHMRLMGQSILVQTRNIGHHVIKALSSDDLRFLYAQELSLRQELNLLPFNHWVTMTFRATLEKSAQAAALDVYNAIIGHLPKGVTLSPVEPDVPPILRLKYRFKLNAQGRDVELMVQMFKEALATIKRRAQVIATLNVDP